MGRKQECGTDTLVCAAQTGVSAPHGTACTMRPGLNFFPMDGKNDSISVEIFGQTYNVRGEGDPDYLTELARFVDSRMREVAAQVATVDTVKIAILAALNIADEFSRYRKQRLGAWIEKTEELSNRLNKVIS
jgi:cell division protein ZapA